jgi:hypothetical protein
MGWFSDIQKAISGTKQPVINRDAQPLIQAFRSEAVIDRQIDELIGIVKGVIVGADRKLTQP